MPKNKKNTASVANPKPGEYIFSTAAAKNSASSKKLSRFLKPKTTILSLVILVVISSGAFITGYVLKVLPGLRLEKAVREMQAVEQKSREAEVTDAAAAAQVWQDYVNRPPRKELRYDAMIFLANAYYEAQKYPQAIEWYNKARDEKGADTSATSYGIALSAQAVGDKDQAIAAYQKTIEIVSKYKDSLPENDLNRFQAENDIATYQKKIDQLKSGELKAGQ